MNIVGYDTAGFEVITEAVRVLLNQFPMLGEGETIKFEELGKESGISFSADNGALITMERRSITDHVYQRCQFPFYIVYRSSTDREKQKMNIQKFLDAIGKWLCMEEVKYQGDTFKLDAYPKLSEEREITKITRMNSYGLTPSADGVQDWLLPVTIEYTNEFDL